MRKYSLKSIVFHWSTSVCVNTAIFMYAFEQIQAIDLSIWKTWATVHSYLYPILVVLVILRAINTFFLERVRMVDQTFLQQRLMQTMVYLLVFAFAVSGWTLMNAKGITAYFFSLPLTYPWVLDSNHLALMGYVYSVSMFLILIFAVFHAAQSRRYLARMLP